MRIRGISGLAVLISVCAAAAPSFASDQPLYQPAPAWVVTAQLPDVVLSDVGNPGPFAELQVRFENGMEWSYIDLATKFNSTQSLAQNNVITFPWIPDKGDFIVHDLVIIRGNQTIDLIAKGQRFTVLRREQSLEQRELTGLLTATLAVEGLQVGDVLRIRASMTRKDPALAGRVQWIAPIIALPAKISGGRMRVQWPISTPMNWKLLAGSVVPEQTRSGGYQNLTIAVPVPKQPEMPEDAPLRFQRPPMIQVSSFADWRDVSKVMTPLYDTTNTIPPGSPLAAEVARIMAAETDPVRRAALALRSVQDNIRYLAIGMDGGNYVPQSPEKTWSVRYGDCKAKTLLLLAMLHAMKIDAEPVLASIGLDDLVTESVPSAGAFNHVFVKARIGGVSYWLDGTGSGTRSADIGDSPPFHNVLPLRRDGAELEYVPWRAPARPVVDINLAVDESGSVDLPTVVDVSLTFRGEHANTLTMMTNQLGPKEKQDLLHEVVTAKLGEGQIDGLTMTADTEAATVTVKGRFVGTSAWKTQDRRSKRKLSLVTGLINFSPDRSKAAWSGIPVTTGQPDRLHYKVRIRLPEQGRGFAFEGRSGISTDKVAGFTVERSVSLTDGMLQMDEVLTSDGSEVPAAAIPAERSNLAKTQAQLPRLIAPADTKRRWQFAESDAAGASQNKGIEDVFAASIAAAEPDAVEALQSRVNYRRGIGNYKGALEDLGAIVIKQPSVESYVAHGTLALELGDTATALADGQAALKLDANSIPAIGLVAEAEARRGNLSRGLALFDQVIALDGEDKPELILAKASLIGEFGDAGEAIRLLEGLNEEKPGNPSVLNGICWIKATRNVELDSALKNCTSAIELSTNSAGALDSRAMVWFRMGRYDDALRDIDAALLQVPGLGPTRFLRALVLQKLGRNEEAQRELAFARRLTPSTERKYARFGLKF